MIVGLELGNEVNSLNYIVSKRESDPRRREGGTLSSAFYVCLFLSLNALNK